MSRYVFIFGFLIFAANSSQASGKSTVTCQAFNATGNQVSASRSFTAQARMSHSIQIADDIIAYIRWPFHTEPVEILIQKNPHYPFNIPSTTTDLAFGSIQVGADGLISGEMDLGVISEGYKLSCQQTL